jgi:hypothetical protein
MRLESRLWRSRGRRRSCDSFLMCRIAHKYIHRKGNFTSGITSFVLDLSSEREVFCDHVVGVGASRRCLRQREILDGRHFLLAAFQVSSDSHPISPRSSLLPSHDTHKLIFTSHSYYSHTSVWPSGQKPIFIIEKLCGESSSPRHDSSGCSPLRAEGL